MTTHDLLVLFADPATQFYLAISLLCVIAAGVIGGVVSAIEAGDGDEEGDEE